MRRRSEEIVLLVVECSERLDWYSVFEGVTLQGIPIKVEQVVWTDVSLLVVYPDSNSAIVTARKAKNPIPGSTQNHDRTFRPDFVLMRSVSRSIGKLDDRNLLFGLKFANIPAVNSLEACYAALERPWIHSELRKVRQRLAAKGIDFPLVDQTYYPSFKEMAIDPGFPCVVKVGACHAGYGKIKVNDRSVFNDVKSLVALHNDYCTAEPFIDYDYEIRVQKIGSHYRAIKRQSPNWKGNTGNASVLFHADMTDTYRTWIDECAKIAGGMDICALDVLHKRDGSGEVILELNDTAIGLVHEFESEDMGYMRDLVLMRMMEQIPWLNSEIKDQTQEQNSSAESKVNDRVSQMESLLQEQISKNAELEKQHQILKQQTQKEKDCILM